MNRHLDLRKLKLPINIKQEGQFPHNLSNPTNEVLLFFIHYNIKFLKDP